MEITGRLESLLPTPPSFNWLRHSPSALFLYTFEDAKMKGMVEI